ncbi:iron-containing alcohol dehydrogenase [Salimicrobium album]|uniref:Alcohol dehydrogenase, class IV n=1 Tax=Salimicrobium album TaxID=50717 RepID=A0A1H3FXY6_9BACI|nr:iron-containing alcohol dehydrogenase [Salimicrobium album]SDX95705.1 Alcohol dehydrogenase, class IV [Salimicrobium album]
MISPQKKIAYRTFQKTMKASSRLLPWRRPELYQGGGSVLSLAEQLAKDGFERVLIVTDSGVKTSGIMDAFLQKIWEQGIEYIVYDRTLPNPTLDNIRDALHEYSYHHCQAIIAFGGGSPMDCAKGVAAKVACPDKTIEDMKGLFRVRRKTPMLIAVPTTTGTGSEGTAATVISNPAHREKYPLIDLSLIPDKAVLDVELVLNLPAQITATTGMDALTHAVESYIGGSGTRETRLLGRKAVRLIFGNLLTSYHHPGNREARFAMQQAAYYAGLAFTRAYVGYTHSIAHTLGGFYGTPHGAANAALLPHVLEYYGETVYESLADLAASAGITTSQMNDREKAEAFITSIRKMNEEMSIEETFPEIKKEDIPAMVEKSLQEAHPLYPVPKFMSAYEMTRIYEKVSAQKV